MKIYPVLPLLNNSQQHKQNTRNTTNPTITQKYNNLSDIPYVPYFGERVDKGLKRFYETNKEFMPDTVRDYIENEASENESPLCAVRNAFIKLDKARTVEDVKNAYKNEPLFKHLISPEESLAKRGILNTLREYKDILDLYGAPAISTGEDLTTYLVKKIFLENETIEEINKDLETDMNEDIKAAFKSDNPDSDYILGSTLRALGITPPKAQYRASLRYTRDGYSDLIGEKISEAQRLMWEMMPPEERTGRARKSVEKFETWWNSLSHEQKLDKIAKQITELEMLKEYKEAQPNKEKTSERKSRPNEEKHESAGSNKLSQDDLFKIWASNNLKIFKAGLSDEDKDKIRVKQMQYQAQRWAQMTPEEKTEYISNMKAGLEPLKFTMMDAWNNCFDIIQDLSKHLKENKIYNPFDMLYSNEEFSNFQSLVMKEFWDKHPEHAQKLGEQIQLSHQRVQQAIENGTFKALKDEIYRKRSDRKKELQRLESLQRKAQEQEPKAPEADSYMKDFEQAYTKATYHLVKNLPQNYMKSYFSIVANNFPKEYIISWTKNLKGEPLSAQDYINLQEIKNTEPKESAKINRALEGALANVTYECTKNPIVYRLSYSDLKVVLYHIEKGDRECSIHSHKLNQTVNIEIKHHKFNKNKIAQLYDSYLQPLPQKELDEIIRNYFVQKDNMFELQQQDADDLADYMNDYGKSILLLFSEKSTLPGQAKGQMFYKFLANMPDNVYKNCRCLMAHENGIINEEYIKLAAKKMQERFGFVPPEYMSIYNKEFGAYVRRTNPKPEELKYLIEYGYNKRQDVKSAAKLSIMPKTLYSEENKIKTLAMEQALGDILYEITGNADVYTLEIEEMFDYVELYRMVKKFPSEERHHKANSGRIIETSAKKRPNTALLPVRYKEYLEEIQDRLKTEDSQDAIICALNPDENMPEIDKAIEERINRLFDANLPTSLSLT